MPEFIELTTNSAATSDLDALQPPTPPPPSRTHLFPVIASLYLGTFIVALDTTILNPILLNITHTFNALDHIAWYGSAYLLALTSLQPTFGKLYKEGYVKALYIASVGVFEVGSLLCATAPSSAIFILGRAIAGCGAAGLMQGSFAVVTKTVPLSQRPFYFGLFVSAFGISIGIGPVLGGLLADRGQWKWCFWINLPLGAVVVGLVAMFLRLRKTDRVRVKHCTNRGDIGRFLFRLDLGGTFLLVASMCCLFMAMQWGGYRLPSSSPTIIGLLAVFGILLALFLLLEWRMGDDASVPFGVLRQRSIASGAVYLFLFSMPNFSYGVYIPMFFQTVKGFSAQRSGEETLFLALTQILTIVVVGALVSRLGCYVPFIIMGTALSVLGSGLIVSLNEGTSHGVWAAYFIICGLGAGCALNLPYTAVSAVLKEEDMVTGNALLHFAFQLGGAVGLCISQTIFLACLTVELQSSVPGMPLPVESMTRDTWPYQSAIVSVFFFLAVTSSVALLVSFGFEHKNVKKVQQAQNMAGAGRAQNAEEG